MANLLQRKANSKYKILKQDNNSEHDCHIISKGEEAKFEYDDVNQSETAKLALAETHIQVSKVTDEQIETKGTSISKVEEGSNSHLNSYECDNHSSPATMSSGKMLEKKPVWETTNNHSGHLDVPELAYEEITDTEDFDLASDEEIPNKISKKQDREKDVGCSNAHLLKQNSGSESSSSTDIESFSDNGDIRMSTVKPKKSFCPLIIMNDKDDDLEDVFLPNTSKHGSSFQKFLTKQSSFTSKKFDDNTLFDTETIETNANETLAMNDFKTDYSIKSITKVHKQQLTCSSDKNYHHKTILDVVDQALDRTSEIGNAGYINVADSQMSFTEMEETIRCSCDEKYNKAGKVHHSQTKFKTANGKTLVVLQGSPEPETDVEDLSDSNAMETQMVLPLLKVTSDLATDFGKVNDSALDIDHNNHCPKQNMQCKFNKQCYEDSNTCVEKNKFCLQHKNSLLSFTKCDENLSAPESALTDVEELDMSEDESENEKIYYSYKSLPVSSKGNKGYRQLTKAVIPKATTSHNTLNGITTDNTPLTDTEDLCFSDVDTTNFEQSKNVYSDAFHP